ncbi:hypothetical protein FOZ62_013964, partial [Perkinsus olseni]
FSYEESLFNMYYDVNENKEVTLTVEAFGPYPLRKEEGFTYTIDFEHSRITSHDWDQSIETFLQNNGVLDPQDPFYPGDLATLTYTFGDTFSVDLRGEPVRFFR